MTKIIHRVLEVLEGERVICQECGEVDGAWVAQAGGKRNLACGVGRREAKRRNHRKITYGMTPEDVLRLLVAQRFGCAVCGTELDYDTVHIDHDHSTGAVRGGLCSPCNVGIGHLGDDPARCRAAAAYLESNNAPDPKAEGAVGVLPGT